MIECEDSAYKHWFTQAQIDYLFRHPVAMFRIQSRIGGDRDLAMVGYVDEFKERKVEIIISQRTKHVYHCMECRREWLHYFE